MDVEKNSNWVLKADVCRCCLAGSGTWNMTATYISETGAKEVFTSLLRDCFGVSLSYMTDPAASRLVCSACVLQLRDASSFRQQVLRADQRFSRYWTTRSDREQRDTISEDGKKIPIECMNEDFYDDLNAPWSPITTKKKLSITVEKRCKIKLRERRQRRKETANSGYDSDTPIARFKEKSNGCVENDGIPEKSKENRLKECGVDIISTGLKKLSSNTKQVSERRRMILNCSIVLVETTACPFRHQKSWFRCFFCTETFMDTSSLRDHYTRTHTNIIDELKKIKRYPRSLQIEISNLECRHCRTTLKDVDKMAEHFRETHSKVIYKECIADYKVDSSPYVCHLCGKQYHVFRNLTVHLNVHYANCICDVCGKSFMNSKRLKVHKRTHEKGSFPCKLCGKVLRTKTSHSNHVETHSRRMIKCHICFKPMKHYNARIKHMSEEHGVTNKFNCPFCDKEFNIKHYLATHVRQTHGHKNKRCKICNMAFITNHGLKKHMSKHTGERPFSCSVCFKSYARSYTLREHMRAHENDKRMDKICNESNAI